MTTKTRSRSQELALAKLREEDIGDDLTARAALVSLANGELPGWKESRDGLLKKLEVCSIIGSLIAAVCLIITDKSPQFPFFRVTTPYFFK